MLHRSTHAVSLSPSKNKKKEKKLDTQLENCQNYATSPLLCPIKFDIERLYQLPGAFWSWFLPKILKFFPNFIILLSCWTYLNRYVPQNIVYLFVRKKKKAVFVIKSHANHPFGRRFSFHSFNAKKKKLTNFLLFLFSIHLGKWLVSSKDYAVLLTKVQLHFG